MRFFVLALPFLSFVLGSCHSPPADPVPPERLASSLESRLDRMPAELERSAAAIAALEPLGLRVPVQRPDHGDAFWHAAALAYAPEVRQARVAVERLRHRLDSIDRPDPLTAGYTQPDFGHPRDRNVFQFAFEVFSLLDVVRRPAYTALAEAELRAAFGLLEARCWEAVFVVDRARIQWLAAHRRRECLETFLVQALEDQRRVHLHQAVGRMPQAQVARVDAQVASLDVRLAHLNLALSEARQALARASGLPSERLPGEACDPAILTQVEGCDPPPAIEDVELVRSHPTLRALVLAYAVTESNIRARAAERWPTLRIGPSLTWTPDEFLLGGILAPTLPFPGSQEGFVTAAVEERAAARLRLEDALLAQRLLIQDREAAHLRSRERLSDSATRAVERGEATWRAARSALEFTLTLDTLERWIDALQLRAATFLLAIDAAEDLWIADLDLREASACRPGLEDVR